jgi:hypothetical protein
MKSDRIKASKAMPVTVKSASHNQIEPYPSQPTSHAQLHYSPRTPTARGAYLRMFFSTATDTTILATGWF